jgi:hypothetical protein
MAMSGEVTTAVGAEEAELTQRIERVERGARVSFSAARGMVLAALGTFPLVAAYHIDLGPELRFELDLGSVLWTALLPGALMFGLNGVRMTRSWRRMLATLDERHPH